MRNFLFICTLLWCFTAIQAQQPITCDGAVYCVVENTNQLGRVVVNATNNSVDVVGFASLDGTDIHALAYRRTDQLLYGLDRVNRHFYRIDGNGNVEDLGEVDVPTGLVYEAGAITNDGALFYATGSENEVDQQIVTININTLAVNTLPVAGGIFMKDIAFHPHTGNLWGYDQNLRTFVEINLGTLEFFGYVPLSPENQIEGIYIDAGGTVFGYGTAAFGVAGAVFSLNTTTGQETRRVTGPVGFISDLAGCPYGLDVKVDVSPKTTFPCEETIFTYYVGNGSGNDLNNLTFEHDFPNGFDAVEVVSNPYGGNVTSVGGDFLRIENMSVAPLQDSIVVRVVSGDIAGGRYKSQGRFLNLPANIGGQRVTDDIDSFAPGDSSFVDINRIEEDSIFRTAFGCLGDEVLLDATEFGANIVWNTGFAGQFLPVTEEGVFFTIVGGSCQEVYVEFDVTFASCPFTIAMPHEIVPRQALPCSEARYVFSVLNDSGVTRDGITFTDTLPPGFSLLDVTRNPFGGTLQNDPDPRIVRITDMAIPLGRDTLELLVEVGDVAPGPYPNLARISGFPLELGPFRTSDDPMTQALDSTFMEVLGVPNDSFYIDTIVCARADLRLNAAPFGRNYLWDDGTTDSIRVVAEPGVYEVTILDGCEPSFIFFTVTEGLPIDLTLESEATIFLGESYDFDPLVLNSGNSLGVFWRAAIDSTLTCLDCLTPTADPLTTSNYTLIVNNEECTDSSVVRLIVDNTRRVYAPNIFSPNADGVNDFFYLQSPDFGEILEFQIYSRFGSLLHNSTTTQMNLLSSGWNGKANNTGKPLEPGVYVWQAKIRFLDGLEETLSGEVMLIR